MSVAATLYFPAGAAIGLISAAPIGPVNLLVIQRTLASNIGTGLLVGSGGAIGDAVLAGVAAFGVGALARLMAAHGAILRIGGAAVMLAFAVVIWRSAPALAARRTGGSALRMTAASLGLTLTNPATLLFLTASFGAVGFVGIGHDTAPHRINAALVVCGVFTGSMLWWLAVTATAARLRDRIGDATLVRLNHGTAIALALFAIGAATTGALDR